MTMSVYDALVAWQRGHITEEKAFQLTGVESRQDLYAVCLNSDVEIRDALTDDRGRPSRKPGRR